MEHPGTGNFRGNSQANGNKKGKRIKRTRSPVHVQNEANSHSQFYRSTNLPLSYQTANGANYMGQKYKPGVGGTPLMSAGVN